MVPRRAKKHGAWNTVETISKNTEMINLKDINVKYVGRKASSSTATGNANKHLAQQKEILEKYRIKCQKK